MKKITRHIDYGEDNIFCDLDLLEDENGNYHLISNITGSIIADLKGSINFKVDGNWVLIGQEYKGSTYLTIYDIENQKIIADQWKVADQSYGIFILEKPNSKTHKYHVFDKNNFDENVFKSGYSLYKYLGYINNAPLFELGLDCKTKWLYIHGRKIIFDSAYEGFEIVGNTLVVADDDRYRFAIVPKDLNKIVYLEGPLSQSITADKTDPNIIYCKVGSSTRAYYSTGNDYAYLFSEKDCKHVEVVGSESSSLKAPDKKYVFKLDKGEDKKGLCDCWVATEDYRSWDFEILADCEYADITKNNQGDYLLKKGEDFYHFGLVRSNGKTTGYLPCEYAEVTPINERYYLLDTDADLYSIYDVEKDAIVFDDFELIKNENGVIIYEKNGKKGIISFVESCGKLTINNLEGCDNVEEAFDNHYYIEKDGLKGLSLLSKKVIPCDYEDIKIEGMYQDQDRVLVFFTATNVDGSHELIRYGEEVGKKTLPTKKYTKYVIWKGFIICFDKKNKYLFNIDFCPLLTLPLDANIKVARLDDNGYPESYLIDNELYDYDSNNKNLKKRNHNSIYSAVYESKYGYVVVNEYSNYDFSCSTESIEKIPDHEFDAILNDMYESSESLRLKYPNLK